MKGIVVRLLGLCVVLAAVGATLTAGETAKTAQTAKESDPLPTDWSHRHVIFSHPRTPEQAARIQKDIRYQLQERREHSHRTLSTKVDPIALSRFRRHRRRYGRHLHRDWSYDLGPGATAGEAHFPAKYSFSSTVANCELAAQPDFIVYPTSLAGASNQGSIVAFTNLYPGCPSGPIPGQYWAYNTGGTVSTSPVLSFDGTQIAFVQTTGGTANLAILRYAAFDGFVDAPTTLTPLGAGSYFGCGAPCMTTLSLGATDTNSSVYYDYGSDTVYVGDDAGNLHQFTGIFKGTPTEVISGWPVPVSAAPLTSAVHDPGSGNTFVGDSAGFLYRIDGSGNVTTSGQLDFGVGLTEGPVVDGGIGVVYAFSSNDGATTPSAGVFQLPTSFTGGSTGSEVTVGAATPALTGTTPLYNGGFDHDYIYSANSTGNIYVCGNPGGAPTLYAVQIAAGVMPAGSVAGPVLSSTGTTKCSPVTDVYNPTVTGQGLPEEWAFVSVEATGTATGCGGVSCIMSFRSTGWQPNYVYNAGQLILDSHMNIQVADNSGQTSGGTAPTWNTNLFGPTVDGGVLWRNQGPLISNPPDPGWTATFAYHGGFEIIDSNNNVEIAELGGGTSGATQPTWPSGEGFETIDGTVVWYNLGANPVAALSASGGTSGIVMDNTAVLGSQVYYSTLQNFPCEFGATGGCAVQASQQGLK